MLLPTLDDLDTYEKLALRCLALDTGLRRIEEIEKELQPHYQKLKSLTIMSRTTGTLAIPLGASPTLGIPSRHSTPETPSRHSTPEMPSRYSTPIAKTVICYNCNKPGHFASSCPGPEESDLKTTEEE